MQAHWNDKTQVSLNNNSHVIFITTEWPFSDQDKSFEIVFVQNVKYH